MDKPIVTIFGSGRTKAEQPAYSIAFETGSVLAEAGFTIANGGYGGTMQAAAQGARQAGGTIIGVTCTAFKSKPNPYISREISTASLDERLQKLIELGRAYIVLGGGTGTLVELAMVWELKNKHFLETDKPVILVGEFWQPLVELMASDDPDSRSYVTVVQSPAQLPKMLNNI